MADFSSRDRLVNSACVVLGRGFRHGLPFPKSPRRILVLKTCCLGDVLFTTPLVAALREAYPDAHLAYGVGSWARPAIEGNQRLDQIVDCGPLRPGRIDWRAFAHTTRALRRGRFDAAFVLERSPLLALIPWLAGIRHRVGLDSFGRGFSFTVPVPVRPDAHEADIYLDTARAIGLGPERPRLEFWPGATATTAVEEVLSQALAPMGSRPPLLVIHPGGGANPGMVLAAKRWAPERFAAVGNRLVRTRGMRVVLVGAESDRGLADAVIRHLDVPPLDLVGRLSWAELGALCATTALFLGNDTGAMHLAVATGTRVLALFGPSDPSTYGPFGPRGRALWTDVGCNPCLRLGRFNEACRDYRCIAAISADEATRAAEELLER